MADDQQQSLHKLVQGCKNDDPQSQRVLFEQYYGMLLGICLRYANDRDEAKDILQEGFVKIFNHIKNYEFTGSFEAWMKRVMINTAIDQYRKHQNEPYLKDIEAGPEPGIPEEGLENLKEEDLLKLIQGLPEGYRVVFNLYIIEGYNHQEIAEMLSINEGTSKSQLAKAKKMLQKKLKTE